MPERFTIWVHIGLERYFAHACMSPREADEAAAAFLRRGSVISMTEGRPEDQRQDGASPALALMLRPKGARTRA